MPGPTNLEQELLELVNETRLNPLQNAKRYISSYAPLTSPDPNIQSALTFFGVNGSALLTAYQALTPVQPVAWNEQLATAARNHSALMLSTNTQDHVLPGEAGVGTRLTSAGYNWQLGGGYGENIYAYSESPLHAHAGFMVDWGFGPNGMQSPAGHRDNIMNGAMRELGIGIVADSNGSNDVGPLLVTQDFGYRIGSGKFILGVAYNDTNANGIYTAGEGLGTLVATLGSTAITSYASGGYSLNTTLSGAQTVTFSGAGLGGLVSVGMTLGTSNVKLDIVNGNTLKTSTSVNVSGPISTIMGLGVTGLSLRANGSNAHTFFGTAGADTMIGGTGADVYNVGAGDTITENQNSGSDTVQSSTISLNLGNYANVEIATLFGTSGLSITGTQGADVLSASANSAANALSGLGGNDIYFVGAGDTITELAGGGTDRVQSSLISLNLANYAFVENITLAGSAALSATGGAGANVIDGASNSAANTLTGLGGNDTYIVGAGDKVVEAASSDIDTVQSSLISLNLASFNNIENARLTGTASLSASGNQANNTIVGNAGNNYLAGGAGLDTLTGGGGLNFYLFNTPLNSATNVDTITDFLAANDTIRLENAIFTAFAGFATGATIGAGNLRFGAGVTTAVDGNDYILYNTTTGDLFYDADGGPGGSSAVKFATLSNRTALTNADLIIA